MPSKPYCSVSVDVDSIDALSRFHGLNNYYFSRIDPIYHKAIPRFLDLFDEYDLKATFFVIGKDCMSSSNQGILREIVSKGHEIANHSLSHIFGFSMLSREDKEFEIQESTQIIKDTSGYLPVGFRAPGYDVDEVTIDILDKTGYLYDSSVYKFFLYPIMRRISYLKSKQVLRSKILKNLSSDLLQLLSPMQTYYPMMGKFWRRGQGRNIVEIPVSIIPYFYFPFNSTFLFLLGPKLFNFGFWLTVKNGMNLNYSFHASDMLSSSYDKVSLKHPGMDINLYSKQSLFRRILEKINKYYRFVTLEMFTKITCSSKHS